VMFFTLKNRTQVNVYLGKFDIRAMWAHYLILELEAYDVQDSTSYDVSCVAVM
jgi:hypothetical protein